MRRPRIDLILRVSNQIQLTSHIHESETMTQKYHQPPLHEPLSRHDEVCTKNHGTPVPPIMGRWDEDEHENTAVACP